MSRRAFHATEFYNALYRPLQVDCELSAALPDSPASSAFLVISLYRQRVDFSERERDLLNLILPHVANARRRLRGLENDPAAARAAFDDEKSFCDWWRGHAPWRLTQRETEVLFWLCQGKTNSEIGRILGIAERTAETHALRVYPKLGVENRYTAIAAVNRLNTILV